MREMKVLWGLTYKYSLIAVILVPIICTLSMSLQCPSPQFPRFPTTVNNRVSTIHYGSAFPLVSLFSIPLLHRVPKATRSTQQTERPRKYISITDRYSSVELRKQHFIHRIVLLLFFSNTITHIIYILKIQRNYLFSIHFNFAIIYFTY